MKKKRDTEERSSGFDGVDKVIRTIKLPNGKDAIRVSITTFPEGNQLLNVRKYYTDKAGELKPAKGVMFPFDALVPVIKALKKAVKYAPAEDTEDDDDGIPEAPKRSKKLLKKRKAK